MTFFYFPHRGFEIRGGKNPQRTSPCELRHRFPIQINGTGKSIGFGRGFRAVVCTNNFLDVFRSIPGGGIKCPYLNVGKYGSHHGGQIVFSAQGSCHHPAFPETDTKYEMRQKETTSRHIFNGGFF